jgi:hypothetical protein
MKKKLKLDIEAIRVDQFVLADRAAMRGTIRGFCEMSDSCSGTQSDGIGPSAPCRYCVHMPDSYSCLPC